MIGTLWLCILAGFQGSPAPTVSVESVGGAPRTGTLVALSPEQITLESDGQPTRIPLRDVLAVVTQPPRVVETPDTTAWIRLVDGSQLEANSYTVKDRVATIQLGDQSLTCDTRVVHTVRFHPPTPELDSSWTEIIRAGGHGDIAVLRRSSTSLDQLEGVFHDITTESIEFEYDEQRIAVKHNKLEGIVYYHGGSPEYPKALCELVAVNGSRWQAKTLELTASALKLSTPCGIDFEVPLTDLSRLDFAAGNVAYLSDLEFEVAECVPFIATRLPAERVLQLYAPRKDASFEGSGLWLGEGNQVTQYTKGLSIHSRSLLVFRLTEPYRKLTAVVGIDSRLQGGGNVVLVVRGDNRELFRQTVSGQQKPLELDLNIEQVRRLEILVDFGETLDVADHLNLCNARIIK